MACWPQRLRARSDVRARDPKSELEWLRLIREARAIYDSIFPPTDAVGERPPDTTGLEEPAHSKESVRMTGRPLPLNRNNSLVQCMGPYSAAIAVHTSMVIAFTRMVANRNIRQRPQDYLASST